MKYHSNKAHSVHEDLSTTTWLLAGWEVNKVMGMLMAVLEPAMQAELGAAHIFPKNGAQQRGSKPLPRRRERGKERT